MTTDRAMHVIAQCMTDTKADLRKRALAARKTAHDLGQGAAAARLLGAISGLPGRVIAGYIPIRTEIDPLSAMTALYGAGYTLCVPVIMGQAMPLTFRTWTPDCVLEQGPFGVQVPRDGVEIVPDIVIVPLVAFDRQGNRLGYGGGFYDRTLQQLRATRPTPAVGFAYAAQEMPLTPEATDQPLDAIVTQDGIVEVELERVPG